MPGKAIPTRAPLLHRLGRWFLRLATTIGLLVLLVTFTPLVEWWANLLAGPWTDAPGEIMIVLTGNILGNGIIGEPTYWRGAYAIIVWREGGWKTVWVSGGGGGASVPLADAMKLFLVTGGIPADAIQTDTASLSTHASAINMRERLQNTPGRKVLLTSDYHMFRAVRAFRKVGIDITPRPFPDALKRGKIWNYRWDVFQDLTIETAKILYYWARGWI